MEYHNPVLLHPSVDALVTNPSGTYVDVTFGGGGHSRAILEKLSPEGRLVAFDQDEESQANLIDDPRFQFVPSNFKNLTRFLQYHKAWPVDGILADLGISSHQIDTAERGFSYSKEGRLDMRMNAAAALSAHEVVNQYDEAQLARLFYTYGELHEGRRLAQQIVRARAEQPIDTTLQLAEALKPSLPRGRENKYLSKIFQALRIEVNHEMEALSEMLRGATDILRKGGRLSVITYHSLEDRMVKNVIKAGNIEGRVESDFYGRRDTPLCAIGKPQTPSAEEVERNPRSRSAKLRIAERT
jgi:S-adenosyl-methyltransferase MraW